MSALDRQRHLLSIAPMMDWTDRHCRVFLRLLSRHVLLYSEMLPVDALIIGGAFHLLSRREEEGAVVAQLGGVHPERLADGARRVEDAGFVEVNLNAGCPSHRVQQAGIGACLMKTPLVAARAVASMKRAVSIPVTVKHRIGVDTVDAESQLVQFVAALADAGCDGFIVHARLAHLRGLNPKQNRQCPALRPDIVYRLKARFPHLHIELNGGIHDLEEAARHLAHLDGVMIGRAAYRNPFLLAGADRAIFGDFSRPTPSRVDVLRKLIDYGERLAAEGEPIWHLARHLLGLFHGRPGARRWRRFLSEHPHRMAASARLLQESLRLAETLEATP